MCFLYESIYVLNEIYLLTQQLNERLLKQQYFLHIQLTISDQTYNSQYMLYNL